MKNVLIRIIVTTFFFLTLFSFPVQAQTPTSTPVQPSALAPETQEEIHAYSQIILIELLSSVSCQLTGIDPVKPQGQCLAIDQQKGLIGYAPSHGGAIGVMANMIASTFNIPISTHDYIADATSHFGLTKKIYAQNFEAGGGGGTTGRADIYQGDTGSGFGGLLPFLPLWKAFRNVVYLLFVLLFVMVGLAIMFRVKIDARTVTSIQNSLPKLVIGLVLITFSYAIVGLLIDVMWVTCYLIFEVVSGAGVRNFDPSNYNPTLLQKTNPFGAIGGFGGIAGIAGNVSGSIGGIIKDLFDGTWGRVIAGIVVGVLGGFLGTQIPGLSFLPGGLAGGLGGIIGGVAGFAGGGKLLGFIGSLIAFIIIAIALFIAMFRLWFLLIKTYVHIILALILGPFWIALGVLPGSKLGFGPWFRDVLANLAIYPTTIMLLMLGNAIVESVGRTPRNGQFIPPLIGDPGGANQIAGFLGLGFIMLTPSVATMVRDALKAPQLKFGTAVLQGIAAGGAAPGRLGSGAIGTAFAPSYKIDGEKGGYTQGGFMDKLKRGFKIPGAG